MDPLHFSISTDAAHFFREFIKAAESEEDLVMTIAPETGAIVLELEKEALDQAIAEIASEARENGLKKLKFRWTVPPEDIHIFDGVPCFVPREMRSVLTGRTLILAGGELRIVPEPPPPHGLGEPR